MKLSEYAKLHGKKYYQAYRDFEAGRIEGAIKVGSSIWIPDEKTKLSPPAAPVLTDKFVSVASVDGYSGKNIARAEIRRNAVSTIIEPANRWSNIYNSFLPYTTISGSDGNPTCLSCRDMVDLCVKAYFNFATVRSVIELMVEFTVSDIYFTKGNTKAREFFSAFARKIDLKSFAKMWFRDYFRAGNVWALRNEVKIDGSNLAALKEAFGAKLDIPKEDLTIPCRYEVLNPADIQLIAGASYDSGVYVKELNKYEIEALRNPRTEADKEIFKSLSPDIQKKIKDKKTSRVLLPLDMSRVYFTAFAKQSYEPFGASVIYPVLDDIEYKSEMKRIDAAVARTMQQAILLVTCGEEESKGGINPKNIDALKEIFKNESVGRVLVADYTTKAEFVVPKIADLLDPKKYEVINQDIKDGLNNILIGSGGTEKFANKSVSLDVFVERLKSARETFLSEFLIPEVNRISDELGFRQYVEPKFTEINFKDENEQARIFTRLYEIGVLTPDEVLRAVETGVLPSKEDSEESQANFRQLKDKGYYAPLTGGTYDQLKLAKTTAALKPTPASATPPAGGRPTGPGKKQKKRAPKRIGASEEEITYSFNKLKEIAIQSTKLQREVEGKLLKKFGLEKLNDEQLSIAEQISEVIIANEDSNNWFKSIDAYIEKPIDTNQERVNQILSLASEHGVPSYVASLMFHSKA